MDGQNSLLSVVGCISHSVASLRLMIKSLLSQQPWEHDPLALNMPWKDDEEMFVRKTLSESGRQGPRLSFGVMRHDHIVKPQPPVRRAIELVARVLREQGHSVLEWDPPSHQHGNDLAYRTWGLDGGRDVHHDFGLSGEPVAPQLSTVYRPELGQEATASEIAETNRALREWRKRYLDYWKHTEHDTGTGRPVDAVISPVAPFPAPRPGRYRAYGESQRSLAIRLVNRALATKDV
jgi:amidase